MSFLKAVSFFERRNLNTSWWIRYIRIIRRSWISSRYSLLGWSESNWILRLRYTVYINNSIFLLSQNGLFNSLFIKNFWSKK